jgi:uncharacterized surface protein with fasciclin (FAS1) repeats
MPGIKHLLTTTALAVPLAFGTASAEAANIMDELKDSDQFSRFVEAIEAAELEDTLEGDGPYTVFAPTDDAFDELPEGVRDALLEEDNKDILEKLLQVHIVEDEEITKSDVEDADDEETKVEALEGDELAVKFSDDEVTVALADASPEYETETETMPAPAAGPQSQSGATTPQTGQSGAQTGTQMPQGGQSGATAGAQTGQSAGGAAGQAETGTGSVTSAQTGETTVVTAEEKDRVGSREAKVTEADIEADNGVIHAIDAVLVPNDVAEDLRELKDKEG